MFLFFLSYFVNLFSLALLSFNHFFPFYLFFSFFLLVVHTLTATDASSACLITLVWPSSTQGENLNNKVFNLCKQSGIYFSCTVLVWDNLIFLYFLWKLRNIWKWPCLPSWGRICLMIVVVPKRLFLRDEIHQILPLQFSLVEEYFLKGPLH